MVSHRRGDATHLERADPSPRRTSTPTLRWVPCGMRDTAGVMQDVQKVRYTTRPPKCAKTHSIPMRGRSEREAEGVIFHPPTPKPAKTRPFTYGRNVEALSDARTKR